MAKTLDFRTYLTLERTLLRRLSKSWVRLSGPVYAAITTACVNHQWDEARRLVSELDMTEVGTENREWIKYLLLSFAMWGAGMVSKERPSFVGGGSFDTLLNQVTTTFLQYLEHGATTQVQDEALQLIAEDEQKATAQKWDESKHPRDEEGQFTDKYGEVFSSTEFQPSHAEGSTHNQLVQMARQIQEATERNPKLLLDPLWGAREGEGRLDWIMTSQGPLEWGGHQEHLPQEYGLAEAHSHGDDPQPLNSEDVYLWLQLAKKTKGRVSRLVVYHNDGQMEILEITRRTKPEVLNFGRKRLSNEVWIHRGGGYERKEQLQDIKAFAEKYGLVFHIFSWKDVQKREYEYGSTQIEVDPTSSAAVTINAARDRIADADVAGHGKDIDGNHVTVRYGLLDDDVDALRAFIASQTPFEVRVSHLEFFPVSEHSEGTVPIVARVISADLRDIEKRIGEYAHFKEKSFPVYRPHITLAYVKPEVVDKYRDLYVDGSFTVSSITISHKNGVKETIPFGIDVTKKDSSTHRYVTPYVSFDKQGLSMLNLVGSLHASRLATWGFTAEAEARGVTQYKLKAVMDGRTSQFCRLVANNRVFEVADARDKVIEVLNVQNPDDLKTVQPWPKQDKASIAAYQAMNDEELQALGLHIPPFHPRCRTVCLTLESDIRTKRPPSTSQQTFSPQVTTQQAFQELGLTVSPEEVDHWNAYVGISPVELLARLSGQAPREVLQHPFSKGVQFLDNGDIQLKAKGVLEDVKYAVNTVLDPFTGQYYLTEAELLAEDPAKAWHHVLGNILVSMLDVGQNMGASSLVVSAAAGEVYSYVKLGFLPEVNDWQVLRVKALDSLHTGSLNPLYQALTTEERWLVDHLLEDRHEQSLLALADLQLQYKGKFVGEWLLEDVGGTLTLDLTDALAVQQAQTYLNTYRKVAA